MAEYRDLYPRIREAGTDLAAISVDSAKRSDTVRQELRLPFPILCDTKRQVVREWGVFEPGKMGGIAKPAVFIVDRDQRVRFQSVDGEASRVPAATVVEFLFAGMDLMPEQARRKVSIPGPVSLIHAIRNVFRFGLRSPKE